MPRTDHEVRITLSVLDRLIDNEPEFTREPPASRSKSLRVMKQAVRRDLEWLLNTRLAFSDYPTDLGEVRRSLACFGLPDFSSANTSRPVDRDWMRRMIEDALQFFEPRLVDVVVTLEGGRGTERSLHFRINGRLRVEPAPEPVTFDTVLEPFSGEFSVRGE